MSAFTSGKSVIIACLIIGWGKRNHILIVLPITDVGVLLNVWYNSMQFDNWHVQHPTLYCRNVEHVLHVMYCCNWCNFLFICPQSYDLIIYYLLSGHHWAKCTWIVFFIRNTHNYNVIFIPLESVVINSKKELVYRFTFDFFFNKWCIMTRKFIQLRVVWDVCRY